LDGDLEVDAAPVLGVLEAAGAGEGSVLGRWSIGRRWERKKGWLIGRRG
jgi:hypothetical protein